MLPSLNGGVISFVACTLFGHDYNSWVTINGSTYRECGQCGKVEYLK
jgi:hypothetical protein